MSLDQMRNAIMNNIYEMIFQEIVGKNASNIFLDSQSIHNCQKVVNRNNGISIFF